MLASVDDNTATLAWVTGAFVHVLEHYQTKLVPYLIEVSEELVFEMELLETRSSVLRAKRRQTWEP